MLYCWGFPSNPILSAPNNGHLYLYFSINDLLSKSGEKLVSEANAMFVSGHKDSDFHYLCSENIKISLELCQRDIGRCY
jgi:hypothetical protein